jgi:hypothetical protein
MGEAARGALSRRCIAGAIAVTVLLASAANVVAAPGDPPAVPQNVTLFVLDLSGSMNEPFPGGGTKLDAAKQAFSDAFRNASGRGGLIGIRTYGDQFPSQPPGARQRNCAEDTRLVVPVGDLRPNVDAVVAQVGGFQGQGDTPIGLALEAAANDIPAGALATVVLFSDGRDECFPFGLGANPSDVAFALRERGIELRTGVSSIETIGLLPDAAADTELKRIAERGGGTYTPIRTPEELAGAQQLLTKLAAPETALRLASAPLVGGSNAQTAPDIPDIPAGQTSVSYSDTIAAGEQRWYRAPAYGPGVGDLSATVFGLPAQEGIDLVIRLQVGETESHQAENLKENAGIPRAPSAFVRCPCFVRGGEDEEFETYSVITLTSEQPLPGRFDLELLIEGEAYGGPATFCEEPQECWYEGEIQNREAELAALRGDAAETAAIDPEGGATNWLPVALSGLLAVAAAAALVFVVRRGRVATAALGPIARPTSFDVDTVGSEREGIVDVSTPPADLVDPIGLPDSAWSSTTPDPKSLTGREVGPLPHSGSTRAGDATTDGGAEWSPRVEESDVMSASEIHDADLAESSLATPAPDPSEDLPPAGWYADPSGAPRRRWWDGGAWTEHVSEDG